MQCFGDGLRNFALDFEEVLGREFAVVDLCPQVLVCGCVDQLYVDAHMVSGALDAAFENVRDAEFPGNLGNLLGRVLVFQHRGARDDLHRTNVGHRRQQVVVNALGEKLVFLAIAAIVERQYGDGEIG